jgi:hypothetical protein
MQQPATFELAVDLKMAKMLGLTVPARPCRRGDRMSKRAFLRYAPATAAFVVTAFMGLLVGTAAAPAADALTATDWEYLKTIGYDEHSFALEAATKRQRNRLHRLINDRRLSDTKKANLIDSYLKAIPIGAVPK